MLQQPEEMQKLQGQLVEPLQLNVYQLHLNPQAMVGFVRLSLEKGGPL